MEPLLHERLRTFAQSLKSTLSTDNFKSADYNLLMYREEAEALADEIERNYIPRPRDKDGIPYNEGDIVYSVDPNTEYSAEVTEVNVSFLEICWEDGSYDWVDACDMQHEKPEVPDSLEKLRDDMRYYAQSVQKGSNLYNECTEFADRLSALIDKEEQ